MTSNEHHCFPFLTSPSQASLSSSSSSFLLSPSDFNNQGSYDQRELITLYPQSQEVDEYGSNGGSDDRQSFSPPSLSTLESGSEYGFKLCEGDQQKGESSSTDKGSVSWMSSKMRLMKKMINSDKSFDAQPPTRGKLWFQDPKQSPSPSNTNSPNPHDLANNTTIIRTCSDCNTTRTPLWRSGPKGPKSLCNACGIRQRKARRALAAAATATTGSGGHGSETSSIQTKVHCNKKKSGKAHATQHKKQFKAGATPDKKQSLGFEDFILNLSNNLALHRVISQDETEAAILLMALSCGLVSR